MAAEPGIPATSKAPGPYADGSTADPMESPESVDEMLMLERDAVGAVLVEPAVGSNGDLVPPDEYLPRLEEIAHDHGQSDLALCNVTPTQKISHFRLRVWDV